MQCPDNQSADISLFVDLGCQSFRFNISICQGLKIGRFIGSIYKDELKQISFRIRPLETLEYVLPVT